MRFLALAFLISCAVQSSATMNHREAKFLAPNEHHPAQILPAIPNYVAGTLISVGTERVLMTAILAQKITSIVQVDVDPSIVRYNLINRELLRIARSREDYVRLRFRASADEWASRVSDPKNILSRSANHRWWRENFERDHQFFDFHYPSLESEKSEPDGFWPPRYLGANYLVEDEAFARIHDLVLRGRLEIRRANLGDLPAMQNLLKEINDRDPISLVDVSNCWWKEYAGIAAIERLSWEVRRFAPQALVVYTDKKYFPGLGARWTYAAVPAGDTKLEGKLANLETDLDRWYPLLPPQLDCELLLDFKKP